MTTAASVNTFERIKFPGVEAFNQTYVNKCQPVIITDVAPKWTAYKKWSDFEYLKAKVGHRETRVYHYLDDRSGKPVSPYGGVTPFRGRIEVSKLKLSDYLDHLQSGNNQEYYLADAEMTEYLPELLEDFELIDWLQIRKNGKLKDPTRPFLYLGIDNYTPNHNHMDNHAMICQVVGEKRFKFYSPSDSRNLYPQSLVGSFNPFYSQIEDIENVDLEQFPRFPKAKAFDVTLRAGECIYLPTHWWHAVYSPGLSIAITMSNLNRSNLIASFPYAGTRSAIARTYVKLTNMFAGSQYSDSVVKQNEE